MEACLPLFFSFPSCWTRWIHLSLLLPFLTYKQMDFCADGTFRGGRGAGVCWNWWIESSLNKKSTCNTGQIGIRFVCVRRTILPAFTARLCYFFCLWSFIIVLPLFSPQLNVLTSCSDSNMRQRLSEKLKLLPMHSQDSCFRKSWILTGATPSSLVSHVKLFLLVSVSSSHIVLA